MLSFVVVVVDNGFAVVAAANLDPEPLRKGRTTTRMHLLTIYSMQGSRCACALENTSEPIIV